MSNLLKSKSLLGVMVVAIVIAGAFMALALTANAQQPVVSASDIQFAATVQQGSSGQASLIWQKFLNHYSSANLVADGAFGPLTSAAARIWQASRSLVADGVLGPMSRASAVAQINAGVVLPGPGTFPAGCSSNSGFSVVTGLPCSGGSNLPTGCSSTAGYSPSTGVKCDSSGSGPSTPSSGTDEGELKNFDSVSADENGFSEDEEGVELYAFEMEADGSDMMVSRVDIYMGQTEAAESNNANDYFDSATLLVDGDEVATLDVEDWDEDDWDQTADADNDEFRLRFDTDFTVNDGDTPTLTVEFDTAGNIDTADSDNATWQIDMATDSVRAEDEAGFSDEYGESNEKTVTVDEVDTGTLDLSTNTDNPDAQSLEADADDDTSGVLVLAFDLEANDGDVLIDELTVTVTLVGTATEVNDVVNTLHLFRDGEEIASESVPLDGGDNAVDITFDIDEDDAAEGTIEDGETAEFTVEADINNLDGGEFDPTDGLNVDFTNVDAEDDAGDNVDADGTATGADQIFYVSGVAVDMGTVTYESVTDGSNTEQVTYNIPLTVTAFGDTRYVGLTADDEEDHTAITNAMSVSYAAQLSSAPTADIVQGNSATTSTWTCDTTIEGGTAYRLDEGEPIDCDLQVILTAATGTPGSFRIHVEGFQTNTLAALTAGATNLVQLLTPAEDFQTAFKFLTQ